MAAHKYRAIYNASAGAIALALHRQTFLCTQPEPYRYCLCTSTRAPMLNSRAVGIGALAMERLCDKGAGGTGGGTDFTPSWLVQCGLGCTFPPAASGCSIFMTLARRRSIPFMPKLWIHSHTNGYARIQCSSQCKPRRGRCLEIGLAEDTARMTRLRQWAVSVRFASHSQPS